MKYIDKFTRRHPRFGIQNLMMHIVILNGIVYAAEVVFLGALTDYSILNHLTLDWTKILHGEVWRIVTFLFIPSSGSAVTYVLSILCAVFVGRTLENYWGKCKFTIYIILCVVLTNLAAFVSPPIFAFIFNGEIIFMSLLIIYGMQFPNTEFRFMFFLPLTGKHLSILYLALLAVKIVQALIYSLWPVALSILATLIPVAIFLSDDISRSVKAFIRRRKYNKKLK